MTIRRSICERAISRMACFPYPLMFLSLLCITLEARMPSPGVGAGAAIEDEVRRKRIMSNVMSVFLLQHRRIRLVLKAVRWPLGAGAVAGLIWFARPDWLWAAVPLMFAGELIQLWSAACLEKHHVFHPCGPYTLVRNPMYDGRFLVGLGLVTVPANPWLLPIFVLWFCIYVTARVRREEKSLAKLFGEPYRSYLAQVPRFIPIPGKRTRAYGALYSFRWSLVVQNHEHLNLMGVVLFFGLVTLRLILR